MMGSALLVEREVQGGGKVASELTDSQWNTMAALIPPEKSGGWPRSLDMRHVLHDTWDVTEDGFTWQMLLKERPPWQSVYSYFGAWRADGAWLALEQIVFYHPVSDTAHHEGRALLFQHCEYFAGIT